MLAGIILIAAGILIAIYSPLLSLIVAWPAHFDGHDRHVVGPFVACRGEWAWRLMLNGTIGGGTGRGFTVSPRSAASC